MSHCPADFWVGKLSKMVVKLFGQFEGTWKLEATLEGIPHCNMCPTDLKNCAATGLAEIRATYLA